MPNYDGKGNERVAIFDASGNEATVTGGALNVTSGTPSAPGVTRIEDGASSTLATVAAFHNADNQALGAGNGLYTGNVGLLLNGGGLVDRQRATGADGIAAVGVTAAATQLAGAAITTTVGAGGITGSANAQSVLVGATGSLLVGDLVLTQDNPEYVEITAITDATHATGIFKSNHAAGQTLTWFHFNQGRDATVGDGAPATGVAIESVGLYNGATIDRQRSNLNVTLLASAARTTTQTEVDQTNYNHRGLVVVLDMTVVGTGSVTLTIEGKDPVSGKYYTLLAGAAVTTNSTNVYRVYPGLTAAANAVANDVLPRTWAIKVTANNANSATYSVGAMLIV